MRIFLSLILFCGVFVLHSYLLALLGVYLIIRYQAPEVVLFALAYDILYGPAAGGMLSGVYVATAATLLVFLIVLPIKRQTRFSSV